MCLFHRHIFEDMQGEMSNRTNQNVYHLIQLSFEYFVDSCAIPKLLPGVLSQIQKVLFSEKFQTWLGYMGSINCLDWYSPDMAEPSLADWKS